MPLQAVFCENNSAARKRYSVCRESHKRWHKDHEVFYHSQQPKINIDPQHVFPERKCRKFGTCICGHGKGSCPDAFHIHQQLVKKLKLIFTKTKTHISEQRLLLEQARIVLRFTGRMSDCEMETKQLQDEHFVHVGYVNYQSWSFSVMALTKVADTNDNGYLELTPSCCSANDLHDHGVRTFVQFAAESFDFQRAYAVKIFVIVDNHELLRDDFMFGGCIEVKGYELIQQFSTWFGSDSEAKCRKSCGEAKGERKKPKGENKRGKRNADAVNKRRKAPKSHSPHMPDDASLTVLADREKEQDDDTEHALDSVIAPAEDSDETVRSEGESEEEEEQDSDDYDVDCESDVPSVHLQPDSPALSVVDGSDAEASKDNCPVRDSGADSDSDSLLAKALGASGSDASANQNRSSSSSSSSSDHSDSSSSSSSSKDNNNPDMETVSSLVPATDRRTPISEHVIHIGDHELHYNVTGEYFRAHCGLHVGCRRQRTLKASQFAFHNRGQGRPLGLLLAWLNDASQYADREAHTKAHARTFSHDKRSHERNSFKDLPDSKIFLDLERPKNEDEKSEPEDIL